MGWGAWFLSGGGEGYDVGGGGGGKREVMKGREEGVCVSGQEKSE